MLCAKDILQPSFSYRSDDSFDRCISLHFFTGLSNSLSSVATGAFNIQFKWVVMKHIKAINQEGFHTFQRVYHCFVYLLIYGHIVTCCPLTFSRRQGNIEQISGVLSGVIFR